MKIKNKFKVSCLKGLKYLTAVLLTIFVIGEAYGVSLAAKTTDRYDDPEFGDAKIVSCEAAKNGGELSVDVTVKAEKRVKSADDKFYLVAINQNTNEVEYVVRGEDQETVLSDEEYTYSLGLGGTTGFGSPFHKYVIMGGPSDGIVLTAVMPMYAVAVKTYGSTTNTLGDYTVISAGEYVSHPEKIAYSDCYNPGRSKKGIQGIDRVLESGSSKYINEENADVSHVYLNINAATCFLKAPVPYETFPSWKEAMEAGYNYTYNNKYYSLVGDPATWSEILNQKGVSVTVQVQLDYRDETAPMINSKARTPGHRLYSWENNETEGREDIEAFFCWLAESLGGVASDDAYVSNWILGNEVNAYKEYQYSGDMTRDEFFLSYAQTYRMFYNAIRSYNKGAKVYVCTDKSWNTDVYGYSVKDFLDTLNSYLDDYEDGKMDWNIAAHPYSSPVSSRAMWINYGVDTTEDSTHLSMFNLCVLTDYIKNHFVHEGPDGEDIMPKVIISEVGWNGKDNEENAAASAVYAYYVAACDPMIVAFELRSMYDEPAESARGLNFGLLNEDSSPRLAFEAYGNCDRDDKDSKSYMKSAKLYKTVSQDTDGWTDLPGIPDDYKLKIYKTSYVPGRNYCHRNADYKEK